MWVHLSLFVFGSLSVEGSSSQPRSGGVCVGLLDTTGVGLCKGRSSVSLRKVFESYLP